VVFGGAGYPGVTVIPTDAMTIKIPMIVETNRSGVNPSYLGGIKVYREQEADSLTGTKPKTGKVELHLKRMTAFAAVPLELMNFSAVSVAAILERGFGEAIGGEQERDILVGAGAIGAQGLSNSQCKISVTRTTNDTLKNTDVLGMRERVIPEYLGEYVWILSHDLFNALATMEAIAGTPAAGLAWMPQGGGVQPFSVAPVNTLLGRPIAWSSKVNYFKSGNGDDIMLVHLPSYILARPRGNGAGVFERSLHLYFDKAMEAFRMITWQDGQVWQPSAITPRSGSSVTISPVIGLAD
jgi:HK97 family phage major capsid protein